MRYSRRAPEQVALLLFDLIAAIAWYVAAAYYVYNVGAVTYLLYEGGLNAAVFTASTIVILLYFRGLYARRQVHLDLMQDLSLALGGAFILQAVVYYLHRGIALPPRVLVLGTAGFAIQFSLHVAHRLLRSRAYRTERLLFVGATPLNRSIASRIAGKPELGYEVAGYVDDRLPPGTELEEGKVLGRLKDLPRIQESLNPHRTIVDVPADSAVLMTSIVADAGRMEEPDELYEFLFHRICSARLQPSALLFRGGGTGPRAMLAVQAVYTNLLALAALILLTPLILGIAVLIKLNSRGPVCDTTRMIGWHMAQFKLFQFRCHSVSKTPTGEYREQTSLGRRLERLHLHRLPQLINVLRGEMAFVGPPPVRPEAAAVLMPPLPYYRLRFAVKPGMTGWSQLNSLPEDDTIMRLEYDLYYIKHLSPALDLSIVMDVVIR